MTDLERLARVLANLGYEALPVITDESGEAHLAASFTSNTGKCTRGHWRRMIDQLVAEAGK